ncbi:SRPBCC domain-containing protein [Streptomyces sp. RB6PN25]|uniref:SRPBCC domain-containing protein n=1 Tax=Streptomyces humicola TaxID=2953240 RepID=A0ABT1PVF9_9ACTN|nr:SRPBCC domain-containing protein [Streptomyces humicola]MCQ4081658.1 SRPBCC domain-containing protein [Streptomyces humicola]
MEHEAFVPFPVDTVRRALADPERVARCVAGLQRDVDPAAGHGGALVGRLRLRLGGSTITYRGSLRIASREDGGIGVEGDGTEARGTGSAQLAMVVALSAADAPLDGTRMRFSAAVKADGRLAECDDATAEAAGRRLLDRFSADLATDLRAEPPVAPPEDADVVDTGVPEDEDDLDVVEVEVPETVAGLEEEPPAPPAEAAHARRTMIGRSAEEVDHAPPRGRYAPVPAPEISTTGDTLRWAAPAAAALIASAVVVGRVLRRRR